MYIYNRETEKVRILLRTHDKYNNWHNVEAHYTNVKSVKQTDMREENIEWKQMEENNEIKNRFWTENKLN